MTDQQRYHQVLFDLEADPGETVNLVDREETRAIAEELRAGVDRQLAATIPDLPSFAPESAGGGTGP
jgi:hypothetical protein